MVYEVQGNACNLNYSVKRCSLQFFFFFFLDVCDPGWSGRRDALTISGFVSSILSFILLFTSLFIHTLLRKCEENFTLY